MRMKQQSYSHLLFSHRSEYLPELRSRRDVNWPWWIKHKHKHRPHIHGPIHKHKHNWTTVDPLKKPNQILHHVHTNSSQRNAHRSPVEKYYCCWNYLCTLISNTYNHTNETIQSRLLLWWCARNYNKRKPPLKQTIYKSFYTYMSARAL